MSRKKSTSTTKWWTPPYNHSAKRFKSKEEWTKADWAGYRKAKREGHIKAAKQAQKQLRGPKGKFISKTPKKLSQQTAYRAAAASVESADTMAGPGQEVVWVEREHQCPPCEQEFPGLVKKVSYPLEQTVSHVLQIQKDIAELKEKLHLAPGRPTANPIETFAIINRTNRNNGILAKLSDAARDNPLLVLAMIGAAIFVGYLMYRNFRRSQSGTLPNTAVAELNVTSVLPETSSLDPRYTNTKEPPSNLNLPGAGPAFGNDKDGEGIFS